MRCLAKGLDLKSLSSFGPVQSGFIYIILIKQDSSLESVTKIYFSYFSTKTYVVGTQKKRLNETVLLSTQNIC